MRRPKETLEERFWRFVTPIDGCWEWQGAKNQAGYGIIWFENKWKRAHRASYELNVGSIGKGLFVCHTCDNPCCVNPNHLWLGTSKENTLDAKAKGRLFLCNHENAVRTGSMVKGEDIGNSKLTEKEVREIRQLLIENKKQRDIARKYEVSAQTINGIAKNRTWRHVH